MGILSRVRAAFGAAVPEFFVPHPSAPSARPANNIADVMVPSPTRGPVRPRAKTRRRTRITPLPVNVTRWLTSDIEEALLQAASGNLARAAQLTRSFARDGMVKGLLGTRYGGLLALPRTLTGDGEVIAALTGSEGKKGLFDIYFPPSELQKLATDGEVLGVGIAEFVQGEEDARPSLVRLDPEFLTYRWSEDTWYYRTIRGLEPVVPGDGHYVLHFPYGRYEPWNHGDWQAIGRAYVAKEHAIFFRLNWINKFANPARVAVSPQGASEEQKQSWFKSVMDWGINQVFGMTPGYDVKMLEVSGQRGIQAFQDQINDSNMEFMVIICGQVVTVTGGAGFANANIHATVRSNLIQQSGNSLAATLSTQALPFVAYDLSGGRTTECAVAWDTRPPQDLKAAADSMTAAGEVVEKLTGKKVEDALAEQGRSVDVIGILNTLAVPIGAARTNAPQLPPIGPAPPPTPGGQTLSRRRLAAVKIRTVGPWKVAIEYPAGSTRSGTGPDGPWSTKMRCDYGYLPGTMAPDGEPVDVYVGDDEAAPLAFVVEQRKKDGSADEPKVFLGFESDEAARAAFLAHVPRWALGPIHPVPLGELADWLTGGFDAAA